MAITLHTPGTEDLGRVVDALGKWQHEGAPMQLHPGDVGWFWRFGATATAAALRTWSSDGQLCAVGLLDGPGLLRLAMAPDAQRDEGLAHRLAADASDPARGVLPRGAADVEVPTGALVDDVLAARGWTAGTRWTPLRHDLEEPADRDSRLRVEVVTPSRVDARVAVQRAAFPRSTFTSARWHAMAVGPAYGTARCLIGYDERGAAVATVTVWSAGPGRPGLVEPMGVHQEHRGHGHGTAITRAGVEALRELGSSSAVVYTPATNAGGVATYRSAGFEPRTSMYDRHREG